ncbi:MAG: hypothetical protein HC915_17355 [Anaerolineae bacterium]|nr:hypothetical protein [Anaerolineae bacterium]
MLALALGLTLLILTLSDTARGETARVWLFFVPFLLLSGLPWLAKSARWDLPLLSGQALYALLLLSVIPPMLTSGGGAACPTH